MKNWFNKFIKSGGTSSQFLMADGSVSSGNAGTVTSVALSAPTGFSVSGSPVTSSGTLALAFSAGYSLPTISSQGNWDTAYNRSLTSIGVSGTTTKTLTLTKQDGSTLTASWSDINTDAVTSVFGRTGAIVATSGDYTTAQVTESGNLYYLDSRARASISGGTGISYNSTTGVITNTITQYTDALARASISGGTGISYNSTSGVITNTITQYTDALARASLSFVAGSGAYNSTTGVITIPTNTSQLTNGAGYITGITSLMVTNALGYTPVTNARQLTINGTTYDLSADRSWTISGTIGGLTSGFIPKATSASTLGNSLIYDDGSGVGIGTTSPVQKLEVVGNIKTGSDNFTNVNGGWFFNGNGSYANGIFAYNTSNNLRLVAPTQIEFTIGFSEIMRLTSGGNLLVGTTTDSGYKLDINGTGRFSGNLDITSAGSTTITNNGINPILDFIRTNSATTPTAQINFKTSQGTVRWQIAINRAIGGFEINEGDASNNRFYISSGGAATFSSSVQGAFFKSTNGTVETVLSYSSTPAGVIGTLTNHPLEIYTNGSVKATFTSAGNLGLGTTSPATKFHAYGSSQGIARFESSQGEVNIALNNSSASGNLIGTVGANFYFYSGGAERLRLDSAGNLGLGVTPSAWGSTSYKAIQGNYGTSYAFDQNVPTAHIVSNAYNNGTNWIYQINAPAARYIVNGWTSEHIWYTAPSGTAGNAISFTQAMTLDSSGNLMVGTTTSGGKLTVVSSTNPFVRIGNTSASDGGLKISYGFSDSHGLHLLYNPGSALAYIDNTYPISSGQVYGNIYFRQNVGGTMTTRMMIKADGGNVGIGTTSPTSMLTLNGTTPFIRIERSGVNTWQIQNNYLVNQNGFSINNISVCVFKLFFLEEVTMAVEVTMTFYEMLAAPANIRPDDQHSASSGHPPTTKSPTSSHDPASTQTPTTAIYPRRHPPAYRAGRGAALEVVGCRIQPPQAPQVLGFPSLQSLVYGVIDQIRREIYLNWGNQKTYRPWL